MKILLFGDLVGRPARNILKQVLHVYKKKYKLDLIIANADNMAHGKGVTKNTVDEITKYGVNIITCGDHIWDTKDSFDILQKDDQNLLFPANFPAVSLEKGYKKLIIGSKKVLIISLIGRVFINNHPDCPFQTVDKILDRNKDADIIVVDFHAEATSEKRALGFYLNSRVSAVLGTHTHIQTADEEILSGGTGYISDVGMVGPKDSILGCEKDLVIEHMLTQTKFQYQISDDDNILINAVVLDVDKKSGKTTKIQRINEVIKSSL